MPIIKINNIDLYYEISGKGYPLLLVAGLASDSQSWQGVVGSLSKDFKVITFDNRGVGRTKCNNNITVSTKAEDAILILDQLNIKKQISWGTLWGDILPKK